MPKGFGGLASLGSSGGGLEITIEQSSLIALRRAMAAEADGKALRRDLLRDLRATAAPVVPAVQDAVRAIPAHVIADPGLRDAVASEVKVAASLSGRDPGVKIKVGTNKDPRGFRFAGRRLNRGSWRHPVFGTETWVEQQGKANWFEDAIKPFRPAFAGAVHKAMDDMAQRIARNVNSGG